MDHFISWFGSDSKTSTARENEEESIRYSPAQPFSPHPRPSNSDPPPAYPRQSSIGLIEQCERKAYEILSHASALELNGNLQEAQAEYTVGLELLLDVLKIEKRENEKSRLRQDIKTFMNRAEVLKSRLNPPSTTRKQPNPPPAQPSIKRASKQREIPKVSPSIPDALRASIEGEILSSTTGVSFEDVVGLEEVKKALNEMVVLPALRPDLFQGLIYRIVCINVSILCLVGDIVLCGCF
jgi:hypothetical protein